MNFQKITNIILSMDENMRYVGFIDRNGNIIHGKMKEGKTSMKSSKQEEVFSHDLVIMRTIQDALNDTLGETSLIHIVRANLHQMIYYYCDFTLYVTIEYHTRYDKILEISDTIQSTIDWWISKTA